MNQDSYHHKDLKNILLVEGLHMINEQGIEAFSMRKLAATCHVSHMAPYKHFQDKESFLKEITAYIEKQFYQTLKKTADTYSQDSQQCIYELGKTYVSFMCNHVDYLKFYFLGSHHHDITEDDIALVSSESSLGVFRDCTLRFLNTTKIPKEYYYEEVILYWALPMGLSTLYAYNVMKKEKEYMSIIERILKREVMLRLAMY